MGACSQAIAFGAKLARAQKSMRSEHVTQSNGGVVQKSSIRKLPIITSAEVIIAVGQIFKIAASRFVNVSEKEINLMKENAIPRNTKHATKFGMTLFKGKM